MCIVFVAKLSYLLSIALVTSHFVSLLLSGHIWRHTIKRAIALSSASNCLVGLLSDSNM